MVSADFIIVSWESKSIRQKQAHKEGSIGRKVYI